MPSFDHFDFAARFYENIPPAPLSAALSDLMAIFPGARILDAGGGTGRLAQVLAQSGARLTVADFSHGMLRIAARKGGLGPTRAAVERLPFPDASFDRVLMVDALHHVYNQQQAAHEMFRVLRPGGRLVIEEPDIDTFTVKLLALAEKLLFMRSRILSGERMAALFEGLPAAISLRREGHTVWLLVEKK